MSDLKAGVTEREAKWASKELETENLQVVVREIEHNSSEYEEMVALRNRVLRAPLGLRLMPEQLDAETDDVLIAAYVGKRMAGCLILTAEGPETAQMRQVGVDDGMRRLGVGRRLVRFAEQTARARGIRTLVLHARESAIPFYQKQGYEVVSDTFMEVTLPHRTMQKQLCK